MLSKAPLRQADSREDFELQLLPLPSTSALCPLDKGQTERSYLLHRSETRQAAEGSWISLTEQLLTSQMESFVAIEAQYFLP